MPPTKHPITDEGEKLILEQRRRVRQNIGSVLQYFRDEYDEHGAPKPERLAARKNKRKKLAETSTSP